MGASRKIAHGMCSAVRIRGVPTISDDYGFETLCNAFYGITHRIKAEDSDITGADL